MTCIVKGQLYVYNNTTNKEWRTIEAGRQHTEAMKAAQVKIKSTIVVDDAN